MVPKLQKPDGDHRDSYFGFVVSVVVAVVVALVSFGAMVLLSRLPARDSVETKASQIGAPAKDPAYTERVPTPSRD